MARASLSNSPANLNLSHSKTVWLQKTVKTGNAMAAFLCQTSVVAEEGNLLAEKWHQLMDDLVEMML